MIALAERFFGAIQAGDLAGVAACYAPTLRVWHSNDRREENRGANLARLRSFVARTRSRHYADRRIVATANGFVQQHRLIAEAADGVVLDTPVCLVATVADGLIVRIDEYLDARDVERWLAS